MSDFFPQMQNCYSQIQQLSEKYIQLHQASFDADPDTLNKIHMYPYRLWYFD